MSFNDLILQHTYHLLIIKYLSLNDIFISAATSLATLDDFVPVMLEAEDENYNLFKLINELNKEVKESKMGGGSNILVLLYCRTAGYYVI